MSNIWRNLISLSASGVVPPGPTDYPLPDEPVNTQTPYPDETLTPFTVDSRFVIVGPNTIDGDVRAGVYTVLDKSNLTLASGRTTSSNVITGGFSITWAVNSQNMSCTVGDYNERMWLNILRNIQNRDIRISATINGNGVSNKTIYFDVNCTYAPANFVIRSIDDWLLLKNAIDNGQEADYYKNATTGCANKRFRLGTNLTFNYSLGNYGIGRYNSSTRGGPYFGGVFDGGDYEITINGTHPYDLSTDSVGGVFNYVKAARILNLNVSGNITSSVGIGAVIGCNMVSCRFERIYSKCDVTSTSWAAAGVYGTAATITARPSDTAVVADFAPIIKDVIFTGNVLANKWASSMTWAACRNATRIITVGKVASENTSNPVKSGVSFDDGDRYTCPDFFLDSLFSKAILLKGNKDNRTCLQVQGAVASSTASRFLNMNDNTKNTNMSSVSRHHTASCTMSDIYYTVATSVSNTTWYQYTGTKKTFAQACSTDLFNGNSNWIKGDVGTNIINNQYATNPYVLMAAKDESYYGEAIVDYMRLVPETSGTITFTQKSNATGSLSYKIGEGSSWSTVTSGSPISVSANDIIYFKGNLQPASASFSAVITIDENYGIGTFSSTCDFSIGGNIMSLLYGDDLEDKLSLASYSAPFHALFARSRVKYASELKLPATTLSANCYANMFNLCEYLLEAPKLPATTVPLGAYYSMFKSCYRLKEMPDIECTTISGKAGMSQMFRFSGLRKFDKCKVTTITNNADYALSMICTSCEELEEVIIPNVSTVAEFTFNSSFAYCVKTNYYRTSVSSCDSDVRNGFRSDCKFVDANGNYITLGNNITCDDFVGLKKVTFPDNFRTSIGRYELQYMFTGCKALKEFRCKNAISNTSNKPKWLGYLGHTSLNGETRNTKGTFITGTNASWGTGVEGYNSSAFNLSQIID